MKNECVLFTEAVRLKDLNYDELCYGSYSPDGEWKPVPSSNSILDQDIAAPLKQQVIKWFATKHRIKVGNYSSVNFRREIVEGFKVIIKGNNAFSVEATSYDDAMNLLIKRLISIIEG